MTWIRPARPSIFNPFRCLGLRFGLQCSLGRSRRPRRMPIPSESVHIITACPPSIVVGKALLFPLVRVNAGFCSCRNPIRSKNHTGQDGRQVFLCTGSVAHTKRDRFVVYSTRPSVVRSHHDGHTQPIRARMKNMQGVELFLLRMMC